jgi:hypothetical protein
VSKKANFIFSVLSRETLPTEIAASDEKIRRGLKKNKLGPWDQGLVDELRELKDGIYGEIRLYCESRYYVGPNQIAAVTPDHFDLARMKTDARAKHPKIADIDEFVRSALHLGLLYVG